jgi:hypothetical protein
VSGKVRGSTAEIFLLANHIPQDLSDSNDSQSAGLQRSPLSYRAKGIIRSTGRKFPRGPTSSNLGLNPHAVMKTLARMPSSCNHLLLPSGMGERGAFGRTETRIWVDVSVSSRISRMVRAPGIGSVVGALVRQDDSGGFFIAEKLRAEPQPLFPGDVVTSSDHSSSGFCSERPRSRGYSKVIR